MNELPLSFFDREADIVARELIGKTLVRKIGRGITRHTITETEAYMGPHDDACHAFKGRTKRTEAMFYKPGTIYIYLIYGMYWMLNIVVREEGYPAAVLIRGIEGYDGPGKLTRALNISNQLNKKTLGKETGVWIEEGEQIHDIDIGHSARIGINYASDTWRNAHLRYFLKRG